MMDTSEKKHIEISIANQTLKLMKKRKIIQEYSVSTAKNGSGEIINSNCTPRGQHTIVEKIGDGEPIGRVFVGRKPTGEIYTPKLQQQYPDRDWILSRILWLSGCEEGKNKGEGVDTHSRYIYIHGAPDEVKMGIPGSHGCVRMRSKDIIELFGKINVSDYVMIND